MNNQLTQIAFFVSDVCLAKRVENMKFRNDYTQTIENHRIMYSWDNYIPIK